MVVAMAGGDAVVWRDIIVLCYGAQAGVRWNRYAILTVPWQVFVIRFTYILMLTIGANGSKSSLVP